MGVIINKENNSENELSRRIDADLREKMTGVQADGEQGTPDFAEDAEYVKDFKKTGRFAWVWVVLGVAVVGLLVMIGLVR